MINILWIGLGGFVGANARYWFGSGINRWLGTGFPWATGIVNITGAFLIGILAIAFARSSSDHETARLFLITGLLGGYTTFSSYTLEGVTLLQEGRWLPAAGYIVGSNLVGLLACACGMAIARAVIA